MKVKLLFALAISALSIPSGALNFTGQLLHVKGSYQIQFNQPGTEKQILPVQANTAQVDSILHELNSLDWVTGSGKITPGNTLVLETIDFVALQRLLGVWESHSVRINFLDFRNVTIDFWNSPLYRKNTYTYALSPGAGKSWRMFFTDEDSVTLGVLRVEQLFAELEIFDPQTGETSHRYQLHKTFLPNYAH